MVNVSHSSAKAKRTPVPDVNNPLENPTSSLLREQSERKIAPADLVEDVWDDVAEKMAEEMMGEELARSEQPKPGDEEDAGSADDLRHSSKGKSEAGRRDAKTGQSDQDRSWRPRRATIRGEEWLIS